MAKLLKEKSMKPKRKYSVAKISPRRWRKIRQMALERVLELEKEEN